MLGQGLGLAACPESPVWLEWVGRGPEAHKARQRLLGAAAGAAEASTEQSTDGRGDEEATQPLAERSSENGSLSNSEQVQYVSQICGLLESCLVSITPHFCREMACC